MNFWSNAKACEARAQNTLADQVGGLTSCTSPRMAIGHEEIIKRLSE